MVDVGLERAGDVPLAGRELLDAGQRLVARALELRVVELLGEVGIGVDDADHGRGHPGVLPACPRSYVAGRTRARIADRRGALALRTHDDRAHRRLRARPARRVRRRPRWNRSTAALQETLLATAGAFLLDLSGLDVHGLQRRQRASARAGAARAARSARWALICPPGCAATGPGAGRRERRAHALRDARRGRRGPRASALTASRLSCGAMPVALRLRRSGRDVRRRPARQRPAVSHEQRSFARDGDGWVLELELPDVLRLEYKLEVDHADGGTDWILRSRQPEARAGRVRREVGARAAGLRRRRRGWRPRRVEGRYDEIADPRPRARRERRDPRLEPGRRRARHAAADAAGQRRPRVRRAVLAHPLRAAMIAAGRAAAVPRRAARARRPQPVVLRLGRLRARARERHRARAARGLRRDRRAGRRWARASAGWRCCTPSGASRARSARSSCSPGSFFMPRYDAHERALQPLRADHPLRARDAARRRSTRSPVPVTITVGPRGGERAQQSRDGACPGRHRGTTCPWRRCRTCTTTSAGGMPSTRT